MVPLGMFADRTFSASNAMTLLVYAALGAVLFFLTLQLQTVSGYGAFLAGIASLPITVCMLFLASRGGELGQRIGPRIPMTVGPIVMGVACVMLLGVGEDVNYWRDVLPGLTVFGLGLSLMVAPLTATVLAAAPNDNAGIASGINNAVARAGSLLAVAALPVAVGLSGDDYADAAVFDVAFREATIICAALLVLGGLVSWLTIPGSLEEADADHPIRQRSAGPRADVSLTNRCGGPHLPWCGEWGSTPCGGRDGRGRAALDRSGRLRPRRAERRQRRPTATPYAVPHGDRGERDWRDGAHGRAHQGGRAAQGRAEEPGHPGVQQGHADRRHHRADPQRQGRAQRRAVVDGAGEHREPRHQPGRGRPRVLPQLHPHRECEPRGAVGPRRRRPARPREEAEGTNPREERRAQARWRPRRTACRSRRLRGAGAHRRRGRQRRGGRAARHAAGQRAARGDLPAASPRVGAQAHREDRRRQGVGPAPRHRGPPRSGHLRAADRPAGGFGRHGRRHLQLHRPLRRPHRARTVVGA